MAVHANYQKRLTKEYKKLEENPVEYIEAHPEENNILKWHYIITGPPQTPYHNGEYHGNIIFPARYPFSPPKILMITPNGRFIPNTSLCLSISEYHPETWNPGWSVGSILSAVLSFMTSREPAAGVTNRYSDAQIQVLAITSREYNRKNPVFKKEFKHLIEKKPKIIGVPSNADKSAPLNTVNTNEVISLTETTQAPDLPNTNHKAPNAYKRHADDLVGHNTQSTKPPVITLDDDGEKRKAEVEEVDLTEEPRVKRAKPTPNSTVEVIDIDTDDENDDDNDNDQKDKSIEKVDTSNNGEPEVFIID